MAFLTGEALFCSILEVQYDALVTLINLAIQAPRQGINFILNLIQSTTMLIFESIRALVIIVEQAIIDALELDDFDLSQTKENICQIAWDCSFLRNYLIEKLGLSDDFKNNFQIFEDIVCKQGLRDVFEDFVSTELLSGLDEQLIKYLAEINQAYDKVGNAVDKWLNGLVNTPILDGKSFQEWMDEIDKYAQCAFATCNWALTSSNQKEDYLDNLSIARLDASGTVTITVDNATLIQISDTTILPLSNLTTPSVGATVQTTDNKQVTVLTASNNGDGTSTVTHQDSATGFVFINEKWIKFTNDKDSLTDKIDELRLRIAANTPARGIQPDDLAR